MLGALADMLFPRVCAGCGRPDPRAHTHLCWDCVAACRFVQPPYCEQCGDPVAGTIDHGYRCALCAHRTVHFDRARSVARFDGPLADAIRALKYHRATWLAGDLADLLAAGFAAHFADVTVDAVCWVPLYRRRRRERTYNQAELLARALARRARLPVTPRGLARTRDTPSQTRLTASRRAANVHGAFRLSRRRWWEGRCVLLVDDVMTTGATVNACAAALKAGGVERVYVLTVARG